MGLHIPIYPVRGQLLELRVPDPQLNASISYAGMYLVRKADGTTLAGTTEEHDSGFANHPTAAGARLFSAPPCTWRRLSKRPTCRIRSPGCDPVARPLATARSRARLAGPLHGQRSLSQRHAPQCHQHTPHCRFDHHRS